MEGNFVDDNFESRFRIILKQTTTDGSFAILPWNPAKYSGNDITLPTSLQKYQRALSLQPKVRGYSKKMHHTGLLNASQCDAFGFPAMTFVARF
jgi:hypothetical protein